jgi:hypothetical protein
MGRYNISVPDDLQRRTDYFLEKHPKEYDGISDLIQQLLLGFLEPNNGGHYLQVFMLYIGYPLLIGIVCLFAYTATGIIYFMYANALTIGLIMASLYLWIQQHKGKK